MTREAAAVQISKLIDFKKFFKKPFEYHRENWIPDETKVSVKIS